MTLVARYISWSKQQDDPHRWHPPMSFMNSRAEIPLRMEPHAPGPVRLAAGSRSRQDEPGRLPVRRVN